MADPVKVNAQTCFNSDGTWSTETPDGIVSVAESLKATFENYVMVSYNSANWKDTDYPDGPPVGKKWNDDVKNSYALGYIRNPEFIKVTAPGGPDQTLGGGYQSDTWEKVQEINSSADWVRVFSCPANTIAAVGAEATREIIANILSDDTSRYTDDQLGKLADARKNAESSTLDFAATDLAETQAAQALRGAPLPAADLVFKEQCFLMSNLNPLARFHKTMQSYGNSWSAPKRLPTNSDPGACIALDAEEPFGFINKLTQSPGDKVFNNMKTSDIASLQPMIRLFKVSPTETKGEEKMQELIFDAYYGAGDDRAGEFWEDTSTRTDLSRYLGDKNSRGQGVGIRDFTFAFEAENPYALKKSISAKLTIFANSFDELLRDRPGAKKGDATYKFIQLALKTGRQRTVVENKDLEVGSDGKLDFRLMAVVGWQQPGKNIPEGALRNAINDSYITLNLTPTIHTFDFDDTGRVTFTINYLAYVDDLFESPYFNIFGKLESSDSTGNTVLERKLKYDILNEECKYDEVDAMQEEDYEDFRKEIVLAQKKLMLAMFHRSTTQNGVFVLPIDSATMTHYLNTGKSIDKSPVAFKNSDYSNKDHNPMTDVLNSAFGNKDPTDWNNFFTGPLDFLKSLATGFDENPKDPTALSTPLRENINETRKSFKTIPFFYAGDLIDTILYLIKESFEDYGKTLTKMAAAPPPDVPGKEGTPVTSDERWTEIVEAELNTIESFRNEFKRFRLILGPLELYTSPKEKAIINLADIPVSVSYFLGWLDDQMGDSDQAQYSLPKFLSDFFNQFIRDYLNNNTCPRPNQRQRVRLSQNVIVGYDVTNDDKDTVATWIKANGPYRASLTKTSPQPLIRISGHEGDSRAFTQNRDEQYNYMVFYAGRIQPQENLKGIKIDDENKGIFHYAIGRDRGLTKTINLQRTSAPGLAELRFEREGYNGLMQLREVYDASIDTFANIKAFPGTYIYIDPKGFAPSTWGHAKEDIDIKNTEGKVIGTKKFDLTRLGIGGYYMIKRSDHSFGPGYAKTNIDAVWVAEIGADGTTATGPLEDERAAQSPAKCKLAPQKEE